MDRESSLLIENPHTETNSSFFYKTKFSVKKFFIGSVGLASGVFFWPSSFESAKIISPILCYPAALGGTLTNAAFNIESYLTFPSLSVFKKKPCKFLIATLISFLCVFPIFLMDSMNDTNDFLHNKERLMEFILLLLNIPVSIDGALILLDQMYLYLTQPSGAQRKSLLNKIYPAVEHFFLLDLKERTFNNFIQLLRRDALNSNTTRQWELLLKPFLWTLALPQVLAYSFISYFGTYRLIENNKGSTELAYTLGILVALGNTIPGVGFTMKGINAMAKSIISLKKPSLISILFILPAIFSGFTTQQAMADSLKELKYAGTFSEILNWTANFGAVFLFNLPQLMALARRIQEDKEKNNNDDKFAFLTPALTDYISQLDKEELNDFSKVINNPAKLTGFFYKLLNAPNQLSETRTHTIGFYQSC